ncbi:MAG: hypothetical protein ACFE9T_02845 [Promethearchaeota archaeon]
MERKKTGLIIFSLIILTFSIIFFYVIIPKINPFHNPLSVDYITNGKYSNCYLVTSVSGPVVIVDKYGNVKWQGPPGFFIHDSDMLPNGNLIIADTWNDLVYEIDTDDPNNILWSWDARNVSDINWTKFAYDRGWTDLSFLENYNPLMGRWAYVNDIDFINGSKFGRNYDSFLISLRNFDLVIEVNYSDSKEIVWWYGQPNNSTLLNHQHEPDRIDNGNTIICDSQNKRVIEINSTTKELVWELKLEFPHGKFRWVRDCDDIGNGLRLITDSGNNRLLVFDTNSKKIIKEIRNPWLSTPYESDLLDNGQIVVGNMLGGNILFIDYDSGIVIHIIGFPHYWAVPFFIICLGTGYHSVQLIKAIKKSNKKNFRKLFDFQVYKILIYLLVSILALYFFNTIVSYLWIFLFEG